MKEKESNGSKEAIVYVNNKYTYRDWFQPLFDGLVCFTNGNKQSGFFVYFGNKRKEFISEFSQYGVVMAKAE